MKLAYKDLTTNRDGYTINNLQAKHNQKPALYNTDTGEVDIVDTPVPNSQTGKHADVMYFEPDTNFVKTFPAGWNWLYLNTTPLEYKVASYLANMAHSMTNSLKPLNDEVTVTELSQILRVSRSKASLVINKLFELGVFGKFEVAIDREYKKYWIFNPYLTIKGKQLKKSVFDLFKGTTIAKVYELNKDKDCPDC